MDTKRLVAIIDDESHLRDSVAQWLHLYGFEPLSFEAAEPALNQADGIHPNPQGARMIAELLYPSLRDMVDDLPPAPEQ